MYGEKPPTNYNCVTAVYCTFCTRILCTRNFKKLLVRLDNEFKVEIIEALKHNALISEYRCRIKPF